MVPHDRPVYQVEHAAQLIMARRSTLHSKAEYICADLSIDSSLFPCSRAADYTFIGGVHDHGMPCDPPNGPAVLVGEGYSWFASQSLANVFAQPICKAAGTS